MLEVEGRAGMDADTEHLPTTAFDTRLFAPEMRVQAWRDSIGVIFDVTLDDRLVPETFSARVSVSAFGQVLLGSVTSQTQGFTRDAKKILADGLDYYLIQVFTRGGCEVQDGRHRRRVRPGDIYIIDASAPLDAVDHDFSHVTAMVPRALLSQGLLRPDAHHRRIIRGDTPLARLLYTYIVGLDRDRADMTVDEGTAAVTALLPLIEGTLNTPCHRRPGEIDPSAVDFATLRAVKCFVDEALSDPMLTPGAIAAGLGLSRSRLYRLFQPQGGVAGYIRRRRLQRSLQDLFDQSHRTMRIGEIAYRWGFKSESDYTRSFRRQYGMAPRDARAARNVVRGDAPMVQDAHRYERWIRKLSA